MRSRTTALFNYKTVAIFMAAAVILFRGLVLAQTQAQCHSLFELKIPTIKMSAQYLGENRGEYIDPITKKKWNVVYFSEFEKKAFEIFPKKNLFWTSLDQKANSVFDPEALSFNHSLIVIDTDFRIFTLPFEERGKYHHSSLTAGKDILFAGTVAFSDGQLRELSDLSGHYKPAPEQTLLILKELRRRGFDLSKLKLSGRIAQVLGHSAMLTPQEVQNLLN